MNGALFHIWWVFHRVGMEMPFPTRYDRWGYNGRITIPPEPRFSAEIRLRYEEKR